MGDHVRPAARSRARCSHDGLPPSHSSRTRRAPIASGRAACPSSTCCCRPPRRRRTSSTSRPRCRTRGGWWAATTCTRRCWSCSAANQRQACRSTRTSSAAGRLLCPCCARSCLWSGACRPPRLARARTPLYLPSTNGRAPRPRCPALRRKCRDVGVDDWRCPCAEELWEHATCPPALAECAAAVVNQRGRTGPGTVCEPVRFVRVVERSARKQPSSVRVGLSWDYWFFQARAACALRSCVVVRVRVLRVRVRVGA
jgi:hypothetical protein